MKWAYTQYLISFVWPVHWRLQGTCHGNSYWASTGGDIAEIPAEPAAEVLRNEGGSWFCTGHCPSNGMLTFSRYHTSWPETRYDFIIIYLLVWLIKQIELQSAFFHEKFLQALVVWSNTTALWALESSLILHLVLTLPTLQI